MPAKHCPASGCWPEVWGYTSGGASTVTVHVRRLRTKIEADPHQPELIETVWGIGYRFRADDHPPPVPAEQSGRRGVQGLVINVHGSSGSD